MASRTFDAEGPEAEAAIGFDYYSQLQDEIDLLDGAADEFDQDRVSRGDLSPVFFGSALTNFGVETFPAAFPADDHLLPCPEGPPQASSTPSKRIFPPLSSRSRPT